MLANSSNDTECCGRCVRAYDDRSKICRLLNECSCHSPPESKVEKNPECIYCGLLKSTIESTVHKKIGCQKTESGAHCYEEIKLMPSVEDTDWKYAERQEWKEYVFMEFNRHFTELTKLDQETIARYWLSRMALREAEAYERGQKDLIEKGYQSKNGNYYLGTIEYGKMICASRDEEWKKAIGEIGQTGYSSPEIVGTFNKALSALLEKMSHE